MIYPVVNPARICRLCESPIERHMKWRFVQVRGKTLIEHRHCDNPFEYFAKAEMAERENRPETDR
jgi:hypothetical protein